MGRLQPYRGGANNFISTSRDTNKMSWATTYSTHFMLVRPPWDRDRSRSSLWTTRVAWRKRWQGSGVNISEHLRWAPRHLAEPVLPKDVQEMKAVYRILNFLDKILPIFPKILFIAVFFVSLGVENPQFFRSTHSLTQQPLNLAHTNGNYM